MGSCTFHGQWTTSMDNDCPWTTIVHGQRLSMDSCPPIDGVVISWTIVHEIQYFAFSMDNSEISWTIRKFHGQFRKFMPILLIKN
jgi:hypothetical protein